MAYSTQAQVQIAVGGADRLKQLADFDADNAIDAGVVDAAIAEADALINSFAGKRYKVPITPVGIEISQLSARIAARYLRRDRQQSLMTDATDEKNDRDWLKMLAEGKVTLSTDVDAPAKSPIVNDKAGERDVSTKNVSRERLKGYW